MAHFAQLDQNNKVLQVIVVDDKNCNDLPFPESETVGLQFLTSLGFAGVWKQTSLNDNFRRRYASIGAFYIPEQDIFTTIKPFQSWGLNSDSEWQAPKPKPLQDGYWEWNEATQEWQR